MENPSRRELIVSTWRRLGTGRVGSKELRAIQNALAKELGKDAVQSPASIARVLADEGAELKHPEIIEFDAKWRADEIEKEEARFKNLNALLSEPSLSIEQGETLIREMELLRSHFSKTDDREALQRLRAIAIEVRQRATSARRDQKSDERVRRQQKEIAQWLGVWLQTPELFEQWLELRRRSPEFKQTFAR
jgi:hypothetical protein